MAVKNTVHLIGVLYSGKDIQGFRIIENPSGRTADIPKDKITQMLMQSPDNTDIIQGLKYSPAVGSVVGSNGSLDRYGKIVNGAVQTNAVVVLNELGDIGYAVTSANGNIIKRYRKADMVKLVAQYNIANGSLVRQEGSEPFIRSIFGGYLREEIPTQVKPENKVVEATKTVETPEKQVREEKTKQQEATPVKTSKNPELDEIAAARRKQMLEKLARIEAGAKRREEEMYGRPVARSSLEFDELPPGMSAKEAFSVREEDHASGIINLFNLEKYKEKVDRRVGVKQEVIHGHSVAWNDSKGSKLRDMSGKYTLDELIGAARMSLKNYKPFFYAALQVIPFTESVEVDTMAASADHIYYNAEFVMDLTLPELVFIMWHELAHILMKHQTRCGPRDHYLWNIACDLYINKYICEENGITPGSGPLMIRANSGSSSDKIIAQLAFPVKEGKAFGLYSSLVNVKEDTPESLYKEMMDAIDRNQKKQQNQQSQGQGQGQQGPGQGQSQSGGMPNGMSSGGGQSSQNQQGQGQSGQGQGGQGGQGNQSQSGQNGQGQGQGQQGQGQSGQGQGQQGQGGGQGQGQGSGQGSGQGQGQGQGSSSGGPGGSNRLPDVTGTVISDIKITDNGDGTKTVTITTMDGQTITATTGSESGDMIKDDNSVKDSSSSADERVSRVLSKTQTIYKKILESGSTCGRGTSSNGVVEAFVEDELVPKVNWRTLVQSRLMKMRTTEKSLSTPDKRFIQRGLYLAGNRFEENYLPGVRVCVDTSGSMSDIDIAIAIKQIMDLCKKYKVDADLVYWDDAIQDVIPFKDLRELNLAKYRAMGRGGTNVECVFEEFSKREYKLGLNGKTNTSLVIIFTDGYFSDPDIKYKKQFGRDTIWVLCATNSSSTFDPPFGVKAKLSSK